MPRFGRVSAFIKSAIASTQGFTVKFQWIPSHIGITGNEKADMLAHAALYHPPKVKAPKSNRVKKPDILNHFGSLWVPPHMPCVTKRFHREEASLLYPIRRGSASTPDWLFKTGRINSPNCTACDETGDIEHFLWSCPKFQEERDTRLKNLQKKDLPHACLQHLVFPERSVIARNETSRFLMEFLRETGFDGHMVKPFGDIVRDARAEQLPALIARLNPPVATIHHHHQLNLCIFSARVKLIKRKRSK